MASTNHFRTAFRGFNREDVVAYIEYMNNQHNAQLEQLRAQAQSPDPALLARLEAAEARCAQLEAQLAEAQAAAPAEVQAEEPAPSCNEELEAYRRAERTERMARDRAQQIYTQAHAVLADVTLKAESASQQFAAIAQSIDRQMAQYQQSVAETRRTFEDAVATLYAIRPEEE